MCVSHVWEEMMGWNAPKGPITLPIDDRGLRVEHFDRIFAVFRRTGYEWMWLDLLAIPPGISAELKADLINTLPDVYRNADAVLVFDALVLQLDSRGVRDIAVGLARGKWMTRVWTY
jgi:hypothetical protein